MRRVRVSYKIENDKDSYPFTTAETRASYEGELLAIVGLAERVVYVIAKDDGRIKEESQHEWKTITWA